MSCWCVQCVFGQDDIKNYETGENGGYSSGDIIYQHCTLEGVDRVWEDGVDPEKKTFMRDDVDFENIMGRVVWAYRPDGKLVMDEQVWKELSERLPLYFEQKRSLHSLSPVPMTYSTVTFNPNPSEVSTQR